jgi:hypothetical protein
MMMMMGNGRAKDAKTEATTPWMNDFCLMI